MAKDNVSGPMPDWIRYSPIRTLNVGLGITPDSLTLSSPKALAGLSSVTLIYRRWGISPRPTE